MIGSGTIINTCGVIIKGISRLLFSTKNKTMLSRNFNECNKYLCFIFKNHWNSRKILTIDKGTLMSGNTMMIICSLAIESLIEEFLNIEAHFENF